MTSPRRTTPSATAKGEMRASTARRELVEADILEHATRLFAERGFASTTLQDIADAAGLTRSALYYYVRSKEELLAKLVKEVTEASAADLHAVAAQTDKQAPAKLAEVAALLVRSIATNAERFRLLLKSEADLPTDVAKAYSAGRHAVLAAVTSVIEEGTRSGAFRPVDPRIAAFGVLGLCNWTAWWYHADLSEVDAVADQLARMAVASLQRDGGVSDELDGVTGALHAIRENVDHLERFLSETSPR